VSSDGRRSPKLGSHGVAGSYEGPDVIVGHWRGLKIELLQTKMNKSHRGTRLGQGAHPLAVAAFLASACIVSESSDSAKKPAADTSTVAVAPAPSPDSAEISTPGYDVLSLDTVGLGAQIDSLSPPASDSGVTHITAKSAEAALTRFPARIPSRGPTVLRLQILLDRAGFSPGIIDATWGGNAAKALEWFRVSTTDSTTAGSAAQKRSGNARTLDKATYERLVAAGRDDPLIVSYEVPADDVEGPFVKIPDLVYDQAKLQCLCFSSPAEELAEKFHTSERMLQQLNPGLDLKSIRAGATLQVPSVAADAPSTDSRISRVVISRKEYWTHAVDSDGRIVAHFPSTLGAGYDPSPSGGFRVTSISTDPHFKYQPALMAEVPDTRPTATLAPGPNSPVGTVWIALSKPHYGIHGTSAPETIGYANSHGCVRLTNWDAERLASLVRPGTPVEFQ
jgi:lipoprotein-anchoring transpeptidase ErfK/SrfK